MVHQQHAGGLFRARYAPFAPHITEGRSTDEPGEEFVVFNPATSEELCTVEAASKADVHRTVDHAHETFKSGSWSQASAHQRAVVLSRLARSLEERVPQFAQIETLQTGRAIREMRAQLGRLPEWLEYFASLLRTNQAFVAPTQGQLLNYVQRVPLGVVAQITPFNHPLLIAIKKIAPALAAGNSVIVKPSELAPISVLEFAQMAVDAGVPQGVLSVLPVYGRTTGVELVSHPLVRKVDITAGTSTGRTLGSIVGGNLASYTAELGGKAPIVVFNDADLESAVNGAAFACFIASGQTCVSGTRLIVHSSIYDRFMEMFIRKVARITRQMGSPNNPRSSMGSVISPLHLERIHEMVRARSSGTLLVGGEPMTGVSPLDGFDFAHGSFYPPTVIADVSTDDQIWKEEIFGPVVVVKQFTDEAEAVELANDSRYGLGAGIWTQDLSRAHRIAGRLESGLVWVNTHHRNDPSSPWGGMKESGIGRENGLEALNAYSQSKSVIINTASVEDSRVKDDWFSEEASGKRYG
ncbi:aldehyde dehydrogenase [Dentipellis sp. KUC8613]|nr:aldehyde dehydrogenase [Dentipellis sp. KUC8613]